jgi:4'-phosphopantetheinyl transferase
LKEAYIKALGVGLSIPLSSFEFVRLGAGGWSLRSLTNAQSDSTSWRFFSWHIAGRYRCALALGIDGILTAV